MEITEEQINDLYRTINLLLIEVGSSGELSADHFSLHDVMLALACIDGGVYDEKAELTIKLREDEAQRIT